MSKKRYAINFMARTAVVAAAYVVFSMVTYSFNADQIQLRLSEVLNLMVLIHPLYFIGVTLGCLITNILSSSMGLIDYIFGTLATLLATLAIIPFKKKIYIAAAFPVIINAFIIGTMLYYIVGENSLFVSCLFIAISEALVMYILGIPLFKTLLKSEKITTYLSFNK